MTSGFSFGSALFLTADVMTRQSAEFQLGSDKHLNLLSDHQVSHGSKFVYEEDL